ncbi:hypothetical protein AUR64_05070 [Haloprofundus marisrubri]|uniref:Uncharacterized protein n=1 Tax=Haloprofundus marisrubri TaxID=1514971 RepID=A0A0W1RDG0_9EURY|nr:hypothetical protein [Haloprofundus marisrubri]KTG11298.1 hypothetical protein AUR64_05070 [Haloprofundus marisrubri]
MTLWVDIARVAIVLNLVLLAALGYVWGRNLMEFRSKHTLGLAMFVAFLFLENALAFYFYNLDATLSVWVTSIPSIAQWSMTVLRVCETGGLLFLTWVTWD